MKNSRIEIDEDEERIGQIEIGQNCTLQDARICVKLGAKVVIGNNAHIRGRVVCEQNSTLIIGNDFVCNAAVEIRSGEGASITIGNGCLFADAAIYNTDYHSICDAETGRRVNGARDVFIGDRVWLAMRSLVLKGSKIDNDSVVAAGAIVSGAFPPNSVLAGVPAAVTRSGVVWSR